MAKTKIEQVAQKLSTMSFDLHQVGIHEELGSLSTVELQDLFDIMIQTKDGKSWLTEDELKAIAETQAFYNEKEKPRANAVFMIEAILFKATHGIPLDLPKIENQIKAQTLEEPKPEEPKSENTQKVQIKDKDHKPERKTTESTDWSLTQKDLDSARETVNATISTIKSQVLRFIDDVNATIPEVENKISTMTSKASDFLGRAQTKLFGAVAVGVTALGWAASSYLNSHTQPTEVPTNIYTPQHLPTSAPTISPADTTPNTFGNIPGKGNPGMEGNAWMILAICAASFAMTAISTYQRKTQKTKEQKAAVEPDVSLPETTVAKVETEIKSIIDTAKNEAHVGYSKDLDLLLDGKNTSDRLVNQVATPFVDKNQEIKIFTHYVDEAAQKIEEAARDAYQNKPVEGTILGHSIVETDKEMTDTIKPPVCKEKAQHWFIKFVSQLWAKLKVWWQNLGQSVKKKESTANGRLFQKDPPNFNKTLMIAAAITDEKLAQPNELNQKESGIMQVKPEHARPEQKKVEDIDEVMPEEHHAETRPSGPGRK